MATHRIRPGTPAAQLETEDDVRDYFAACLQESHDDIPLMAHALGVIARARPDGSAPGAGLHRIQAALDALARAHGQQAPRIGIMSHDEYFARARAMARAIDRGDDFPPPRCPRCGSRTAKPWWSICRTPRN